MFLFLSFHKQYLRSVLKRKIYKACNFAAKLHRRDFLENFTKYFRTVFLKKISGKLRLLVVKSYSAFFKARRKKKKSKNASCKMV